MLQKKILDCDDAANMIKTAQNYAASENCKVSIAVVDDAGVLIAFLKMDGASTASVDMAIAKAKTAAIGRRTTKSYESMLNEGRLSLITAPGLTCIEGGLPLQHGGEWLGAIGVSGVSSCKDAAIATEGARTLENYTSN